MTDINNVVLVGRLTKDVGELRYTSGGMAIGNISIAVNRSAKQNEQWVDEASFFECSIFGKTAENLKQYLTKGQQVAIEGSLKQDRWKDNNGDNHSKVTISVSSIQLLNGKKNSNGNTAQECQTNAQDGMSYQRQNVIAPNGEFQEDIPF